MGSWRGSSALTIRPKPRPKPEAGFPAHAGELPTFPTVAGPALGKRAGRPAHPAGRGNCWAAPPQTLHRWVKLGKLPAAQVGRFQYCPKGELPPFFGHPGAAAKLPGAAAPVFGPGGVRRSRGEEEPEAAASGSSPWRFSAAGGPTIFLCFSAKCDRVILSYSRQECGEDDGGCRGIRFCGESIRWTTLFF